MPCNLCQYHMVLLHPPPPFFASACAIHCRLHAILPLPHVVGLWTSTAHSPTKPALTTSAITFPSSLPCFPAFQAHPALGSPALWCDPARSAMPLVRVKKETSTDARSWQNNKAIGGKIKLLIILQKNYEINGPGLGWDFSLWKPYYRQLSFSFAIIGIHKK